MITCDLQKKSLRLAILHKQCFDHFPRPYSANTFYEFLQNKNYYLAEVKYKGFAIARVVSEVAELITIAVDPCFRGKGIGQKVLNELIYKVLDTNANQFILEVASNNQAAINLYIKLGFTAMHKRKNYFRHKNVAIDAIVFKRLLQLI